MSQITKIDAISHVATETFPTIIREEPISADTEKEVPIDRIKEISTLLKFMNFWGITLHKTPKCNLWGMIVAIIMHALVLLSFCHTLYIATTTEDMVFKMTALVIFLSQLMVLISFRRIKPNINKIVNIIQNLPVSYGVGIHYRSCKNPILFRIIAISLHGMLFYAYTAWFITLPGYKALFDRVGCGTFVNNFSNGKSEYLFAIIQLLEIVFVDVPFTAFFVCYYSFCRLLQNDIECFKKVLAKSVHGMPHIFSVYNQIWNAINETNSIFSNLLWWWMIIIILQGIFYGSVGLKIILSGKEQLWGIYFLATIFFIIVCFVDAVLSASSIFFKASDISICLTDLMVSPCQETSRFAMTLYLKNTLQPPQMTVGESTGINDGLLFTVFSTIVTYFIVVMQMDF